MTTNIIQKIQQAVQQESFDGWLFYNFRNIDPSANKILQMPEDALLSRRWFYLIPADGEPVKLIHVIEPTALQHLPGKKLVYSSWESLHQKLRLMLADYKDICMQYSPQNAIPYVSFVDAGTVELVRSCDISVQSSANLVQLFEAVWNDEQRESHLRAADALYDIVQSAFALVGESLQKGGEIGEYRVQQFILEQFAARNMETDHGPIVAVNAHAGNPHYETNAEDSSIIQRGDLLLIDLFAKEQNSDAIYADITWMAYVGETPTKEHLKVFEIVRNARDSAVEFIRKRFADGEAVYGYEVDAVARKVIGDAGYGKYFVHRTGHSIDRDLHGKGVNIDNLETKDERRLIEGIGFSIEPGIYLKEFGVRSEINVYIHNGEAHISGKAQSSLVLIPG